MPQALAVPLMVATTAVTAYGTYQAGKAQEKQANYNAEIAERDATIRENNLIDFDKRIDFEVGQMRKTFNAYRGQNVVNYAAKGIEMSGTVDEVMRANLETYLDDEYNFKYNAAKEKQAEGDAAALTRISAAADRAKGKYARASANLSTFGTLLSGASNVASYQSLIA